MGVRIVTDSSCDLAPDEAEVLGIDIVPLSIRFGDKEFTDRVELSVDEFYRRREETGKIPQTRAPRARVELSVDEFYRRLTESEQLPETAAPAPGAFEQVFRRASEQRAHAVVCI